MQDKSYVVNHKIIYLKEDDYEEQMLHTVRPLLEEYQETGYFQSYDGTKIYYESYLNPREKAAIVISHGFCEFTKKFEEVIYYFLQAGYSVYIADHRGHGYSQRTIEDNSKVTIHSYDEYVHDFHSFVSHVVLKDRGPQKLVLYAHSMGGAIAALYLEQYPDIFSCAILSSPMMEMNTGRLPVGLVWLVMLYKKLTGSEGEYVTGHRAFDEVPRFETSSCISEVRYHNSFSKRLQDKNYRTNGATFAWTLASLKALRKLQRNAELIETPILLFQAGKDSTVKPGGQKRFAKRTKHTQLVRIPDSKHEIYNASTELIELYYQKMFAFLDEILQDVGDNKGDE